MRVAAAGRGLIYTSASFSGQSDFVSQKFCICVNTVVTKSACPTAAEKRLSASICLCRRCRSQPLSSVSRKQRYNTLDFASKIVCQQGCFSPLLETQSRGESPLWTPHHFLRLCIYKPHFAFDLPSLENAKPLQSSSYTGMKIAAVF